MEPYGFGSFDSLGAVYTVVNPAQSVEELELPKLSRVQAPLGAGRILFRDAGFVPVLRGNRITLGPGEMAAVGFGRYAEPAFNFGIQEDVVIPRAIAPLEGKFQDAGKNAIEAVIQPPANGDLRIIFQQRDENGNITRSWPGGPPNGKSVGTVLKIFAEQHSKILSIDIQYDKLIWSGLSWGAGEIRAKDITAGAEIRIRCSSEEQGPVKLDARLYSVTY